MDQPIEKILSILEKASEGALGTIDENKPFVSAAGFIFLKEKNASKLGGGIYVLLSDLARHTRHLKKNPEASLLIMDNQSGLPVYERKRFTLEGVMSKVENPEGRAKLKAKYLEVFPRSEIFFTLPDFHFYQLEVREIYWVGGFGKIATLK